MLRKVNWEIVLKNKSKAAFERCMRGILDCAVQVQDTFCLGSVEDRFCSPVLLIRMAPENLERFTAVVQPLEIKYKSPAVFKFGSMVPMYQTPADEIATVTLNLAKDTWPSKQK